MTQFELNFSYKLEEMMSTIVHPEYRQLIVEVRYIDTVSFSHRQLTNLFQLLCIVATVLERNPEVSFHDKFDCEDVSLKGKGYGSLSLSRIDWNKEVAEKM